jgi:hypothetical protein
MWGDVGQTLLVAVQYGFADSSDELLVCVLRMFWSPGTHITRILEVRIKKQFCRWVDKILNNILRCSSLVMFDCGLLLELGSSHRRGRCELFKIGSLRSSLPSVFRHDTTFA